MLSPQAAVTKLRNDAVVVPLNQQGPLNDTAAGAGQQSAGNEDPLLSSMDPDLADAGVAADSTSRGAASARQGGCQQGGLRGRRVAGWHKSQGHETRRRLQGSWPRDGDGWRTGNPADGTCYTCGIIAVVVLSVVLVPWHGE